MSNQETIKIVDVQQILENNCYLELAILIGSRATNTASPDSDWDIALQWQSDIEAVQKLAQTEMLRNQLAKVLNIIDNKVDLVDIQNAGLAMHEVIANEGLILKGENTLALSHFLLKTWRRLEEFYWNRIYAA